MNLLDRELKIPQKYIKDKDVLIVGFMDHGQQNFEQNYDDKKCEYPYIEEAAKSCVGIDIAEADYQELREKGFDVYQDNVLEFNTKFEGSFDVVTAVNVLDHIPNVESFYQNIRTYLRDDGVLIVWYDDLLSIDHMIKRFKGKRPDEDNIFKLSPNMLRNHAELYGFTIEELDYIRPKNSKLDIITPNKLKDIFFRSFICIMRKDSELI